jgi:hypothetical protein
MVDMGVTLPAAMTVRVADGTYTDGDKECVLVGDTDFVLTADATYDKEVSIRLIHRESDGDIALWKDEYLLDGVDEPDNAPADYVIVDRIVFLIVTANQTDLSNEDVHALKVV